MSVRGISVAGGWLVTSIAIAWLLSIGSAAADAGRWVQATATPVPNLLTNGDFEGIFTRQWNAANAEWVNGRVAAGWNAWWRRPTGPEGEYPGECPEDSLHCQPWHRPEYRETKGVPYTPPRIRSGSNSQMYFTTFGIHEGGLYQQVSGVPPGWTVRFAIWVRAWSTSDTQDQFHSSGQPSMHLRLGIDPGGGVDPWSEEVVWSEAFDAFDEFSQHSVTTFARADTVTVFFRSMPERALKHIDVALDDATLTAGPPPPTVVVIDSPNDVAGLPALNATPGAANERSVVHVIQPGDTLFAIAQSYGADLNAIYARNGLDESSFLQVGQSIAIPLPVESTPTPVPLPVREEVAAGTLCLGAFEDIVADGRYGEGDGDLPGAAFIVSDAAGTTVAASNRAQCFDGLPVGVYSVAAQVPAGYVATTDTHWGVALTADARVNVVVGGRRVIESTPASAPDAADISAGTTIAVGLGAIVLLAAVVIRARANRRAD